MVKVVFCLRRRPDLSVTEFNRYWRDVHAPLVREAIDRLGAVRYVQVRTLDHPANAALQAPRGGPPGFDGVAEIYWADEEAFAQAVATSEARAASRELIADEANFIDLAASPIWFARDDEIVASAP